MRYIFLQRLVMESICLKNIEWEFGIEYGIVSSKPHEGEVPTFQSNVIEYYVHLQLKDLAHLNYMSMFNKMNKSQTTSDLWDPS